MLALVRGCDTMHKNWVTVSKDIAYEALKWAKQSPQYITNDFSVIGGRTEHYQRGDALAEFDEMFGVKQ